MVRFIETKAKFDELKAGDKIVFVDFTASWCGPCKTIGPVFEEMAEKYPDMEFVKVDVDDNDETAAAEKISAMPTFRVYKNGKQIDEMVGANKKTLQDLCIKYAESSNNQTKS